MGDSEKVACIEQQKVSESRKPAFWESACCSCSA